MFFMNPFFSKSIHYLRKFSTEDLKTLGLYNILPRILALKEYICHAKKSKSMNKMFTEKKRKRDTYPMLIS